MEGYAVSGGVDDAQAMAGPQAAGDLQAAAGAAGAGVGSFSAQLAGSSQARAGTGSSPALLAGASRGRPSSGASGAKTKNGGALICQVEGCCEPLDSLKEYHQRYKVCETHLKIPSIIRDGIEVRFCQQCGRFQPLPDFDGDKRSCRVRLQRHNARRRKRPREGAGGAGAELAGGELMPAGVLTAEQLAQMAQYMPAAALPVPVSPQELQAMQSALHFATATLAHVPLAGPKAAAEEDGEDPDGGVDGGAAVAGMGPGSMPFVPPPDTMILLLKSYAAMFHYTLDSATIRALAPISEVPAELALPDGAADAAGAAGLPDVLGAQQQLLAQQAGMLGGMLPALLVDGGAAAGELEEGGEEQQPSGGGGDGAAKAEAAAGDHGAAEADGAQQGAAEPPAAAQASPGIAAEAAEAAQAEEIELGAAGADAGLGDAPFSATAAAAAAAAAEIERAALAAVQAQVQAHLAAALAQGQQQDGAMGMDEAAEQE